MDTVDNPGRPGDERRNIRAEMPFDGTPAPLDAAGAPPNGSNVDGVVPIPGENPTVGSSGAGSTRHGPDLAREALRAAREAAAQRAAERRTAGVRTRAAGSSSRRRRRWSGPGPDDRDPQPLGRVASRVAMDRGWTPRLTDGSVLGRWPQLVGAEIADHCTPVSLRDGELTVAAESTAWASQLRTLQRQLLVRLSAAVGPGVVRRIKVVGPSAPSWRYGPRHVRGRGPRDTYG